MLSNEKKSLARINLNSSEWATSLKKFSNCLAYLGKSLMKDIICSLTIGTTLPIAMDITLIIKIYSNKMDKILFFMYLSKNLTTGLKIKNKNPAIRIGKNKVEKNTPIGSNKNVSLVERYTIVKIIKTWSDQFLNLLFVNQCHLFGK